MELNGMMIAIPVSVGMERSHALRFGVVLDLA